MQDFFGLDWVLLGNSGAAWFRAVVVFVAVASGLFLLVSLLARRMSALALVTHTDLDDLLAELLRKTKSFFILAAALWMATGFLSLEDSVSGALVRVLVLALILQGGFWAVGVVTYLIGRYHRRQVETDPASATALVVMSFIARALVWAMALLLMLDNVGVDVTALITGLGIGGIAVALALQNILSDLFASLSILIDKPFVVGDFVVVGEFMGAVEHVGLKTTRIRSLSGEQIVVSNSDLLASRIRNFKHMNERRTVFQIGVTYDTPLEKLQAIPTIIREAVERQDKTRFDRSHFKTYGSFSLDFETVYYMLIPDYSTFMDTQQRINLELFRRFQEEGIEFAYPTQTLIVRPESPSLQTSATQ